MTKDVSDDGSVDDGHLLAGTSYWQLLGKLVAGFSIPLLAFTVLLALRLGAYITWNYWLVFSPLFLTLFGFLLATASQTLSAPAPVQVRVIWLIWVIAMSIFVVFLVFRLDDTSFFTPTVTVLFIPLYSGLGMMFVVGLNLLITACFCGTNQRSQKKYIIAATPIFCFAVVVIPLVVLISFKEGVDHIPNTSWAVIFIPLFVCDAFCFCMGFFLLIFSFGSRKDALFSILQLLIFLIIIPTSVTFKILLFLYLDGTLHIPVIYVFVPLIVMELLLFTCGIAVLTHRKKHKYAPVKIAT